MDLALNNLQWLICHKTQTTNHQQTCMIHIKNWRKICIRQYFNLRPHVSKILQNFCVILTDNSKQIAYRNCRRFIYSKKLHYEDKYIKRFWHVWNAGNNVTLQKQIFNFSDNYIHHLVNSDDYLYLHNVSADTSFLKHFSLDPSAYTEPKVSFNLRK